MTVVTRYIVYPEGETQEIEAPLRLGQLVDLNGSPLALPLKNARIIAYRVTGIRRREATGSLDEYHLVELVPPAELREFLA